MGISIDPYRILPLPPLSAGKPRRLAAHWHAPKFAIPWNSFHHSFRGSLDAVFGGPRAPKQFLGGKYFRDCWVERRIPGRAVAIAGILHVIFFLLPYPHLSPTRRAASRQADVELTWPVAAWDLPSVNLKSENHKAGPPNSPSAPLMPKVTDAYHPGQTIFTDSLHPTHPRQTLVNSAAPPEPPKILPSLPNIVQLAQASNPDRPRLSIDRDALAKLRPRQQAMRSTPDVPLPQVPNLENHVADLNFAAQSPSIPKPALPLNASAAPRFRPRARSGESGPAPDLQGASANSAVSRTFIALSATPAPPPEQLPLVHGNLSARLAIYPEGNKPGSTAATDKSTSGQGGKAPGGGPNGLDDASLGRGNGSPVGVSISGGDAAATRPVSGLGMAPPVSLAAPAANAVPRNASNGRAANAGPSDTSRKTLAQNLAALTPETKPEKILGAKKIHTLHVNMPNLSSAAGSWILSFAELQDDGSLANSRAAISRAPNDDLSGPVPLHKVDPKYPPALIKEKVEGEVVLYAVIRKDGSVDSIQLVSGLDEQLDTNAMEALSRWKFRPGERAGTPVELEAIVHIPFRIGRSRF